MSNTVADVYANCSDDPAAHGREAQVYDAIHAIISPRHEVLRLLPHMGLQTVSWLVQGTMLQRDSLGTGDVSGHRP